MKHITPTNGGVSLLLVTLAKWEDFDDMAGFVMPSTTPGKIAADIFSKPTRLGTCLSMWKLKEVLEWLRNPRRNAATSG